MAFFPPFSHDRLSIYPPPKSARGAQTTALSLLFQIHPFELTRPAPRAPQIFAGTKRSHSHLNLYSHVQHTRDYECVGLMKPGKASAFAPASQATDAVPPPWPIPLGTHRSPHPFSRALPCSFLLLLAPPRFPHEGASRRPAPLVLRAQTPFARARTRVLRASLLFKKIPPADVYVITRERPGIRMRKCLSKSLRARVDLAARSRRCEPSGKAPSTPGLEMHSPQKLEIILVQWQFHEASMTLGSAD